MSIKIILVFNSCQSKFETNSDLNKSKICDFIGQTQQFDTVLLDRSTYIYQGDFAKMESFSSVRDDIAINFIETDLSVESVFRQISEENIEKVDQMQINSSKLNFIFYSFRPLRKEEKRNLVFQCNELFLKADRTRLECWKLYLIVNYPIPELDSVKK